MSAVMTKAEHDELPRRLDPPPAPRRRPENYTAQDHADIVLRLLDRIASDTILIGEQLAQAKERLDHGEWLRMFKGHPTPVERPLPFGARTGQMLMKIAAHPVLSDANHGSHLPTSWRTLYELTRLPEEMLKKALDAALIGPGMTRSQVTQLRVRLTPRTAVLIRSAVQFEPLPATNDEPPATWDYDGARERLTAALQAELERCPDDAIGELVALLEQLHRELVAGLVPA
jgi:hypothetical protein